MSWLWAAFISVTLPPASSWMWDVLLRRWVKPTWAAFVGGWAGSAGVGLGYGSATRDWPWAAGSGISLIILLAIWLYRRRKRKRAAALLGAKSRALRDALVRTMRRLGPSRVLRPHPVPS